MGGSIEKNFLGIWINGSHLVFDLNTGRRSHGVIATFNRHARQLA